MIHAAATLLDPRVKNNATVMTPDHKTRAITTLREMIAQGAERREVSDQAKHHDGEDEEPPLKRSRTSPENPVSSFFGDLFQMAQPSNAVDDLAEYLETAGKWDTYFAVE